MKAVLSLPQKRDLLNVYVLLSEYLKLVRNLLRNC